MIGISICAWRRPDYLKRVLGSIGNAEGSKDVALIISIDGDPDEEVVKAARKIKFAPAMVTVHTRHIGCNLNTKFALTHAFAHFDYVIHLEDDTPIAHDTLKMFEWMRGFGSRPDIFTVTAWGFLPWDPKPEHNGQFILRRHFSCWGWATWRDRWAEMQREWTQGPDHGASWDYQVDNVRKGRFQVQPLVSRTENIGAMLGTHRGDYRLNYWAGSESFKPPSSYKLIEP